MGQQAERARGAQRLDRVAHALGGLVDVLQDAVAEHRVETAAVDDVEQAEDVALDATDPVGHPGLGRAALQCEERVGARVDDGDAVAEPGGGHGEVARAAPGVQYVQGVPADRLGLTVQSVLEDLPDHGGTKGGAGARLVRHGR